MSQPIRVVLIDDDKSIRMLLRCSFDSDPRFEVVGEAYDGRSALRTIEMERPDAVVLDLMMPNMDGYHALGQIRFCAPEMKVLVLTAAEVIPENLANKGADAVYSKEALVDGYTVPNTVAELVGAVSYF